jgi:hypothetical protein
MITEQSGNGAVGPGRTAPAQALLGVFDFYYQRHAFVDLLTSRVQLAVAAFEQKLEHVDFVAMVNPRLPAAFQGYGVTET